MEFWIDVENAAGTVQGSGPIRSATVWRQTRRLNGAGYYSFSFPASDTAALALLTNKRIVRCYAVLGGVVTEVGAGIVDQVETRWNGQGLTATVSGPDLLGELTRRVIRTQLASVDFNNKRHIPSALIQVWTSGWTMEDEDGNSITLSPFGNVTEEDVYARFRADTVLAGLVKVAEVAGEFFRMGTDRTLVWIGPVSDFPASGVRAVGGAEPVALGAASGLCAITSFEKMSDSADWANYAIINGSGSGDVRVGLRSATTWPAGFVDATSGTTTMTFSGDEATGDDADGVTWKVERAYGYLENYDHRTANGYFEVRLDYTDQGPQTNTDANATAAANALVQAAYHHLKARAVTPVFYRLSVAGLDRIVYPGTTIRVAARRFVDGSAVLDVDADLRILETSWEISERGLHTVDLSVTDGQRFPVSGNGMLVESVKQAAVMRGHPQTAPYFLELPFVENFDDTYSAYLDWDLGSAYVMVFSVVVKFKIDAFRSTVDTVVNGALTINSTALGNSGPGGDHSHTLALSNSTAGSAVWYQSSTLRVAGGGTVYTGYTGSHVHPPPADHAHTGSSNVSVTTGIREQGPTETAAGANFSINVGSPTNSVSGPDGSGWYTLDLTPNVTNTTTYRPTQTAHRLAVGAGSGKFGLLRARVQITGVLQGIQ